MTQYSYSRVSLFKDCPYHFKLRYIDKLTEIPNFTATNPLILGHALHTGIETDYETAVEEYTNSFSIIDDSHIEESMKLEILIPKVKQFLKETFSDDFELIHEYQIDKPDYIGYVDLIAVSPSGECVVIDFKYSNNIQNYKKSGQLHIYKHYLEQDGFDVKKMGFLFVPKTNIRKGKTEDQHHFRKRIVEEVGKSSVTFLPIEYDEMEVVYFHNTIKEIERTTEYSKNVSGNCFSCAGIDAKKSGRWTTLTPPDFLETIQDKNGEILMQLPVNERRNVEKVQKRVFWLYGAPMSGKTTFANDFPDPLMLNTDGNVRLVDAPFISIANEVSSTGRVTNTTLAWDKFKDALAELEKKDNDFKTIVVDLLEDTYESCRLYMYDKLGIEHEADNSFKAWDMVRTEFLSTIKRVVHLDYENIIFISHEDTTKDVTKKSGDKITAIKPNLQEKAALKVAGMVDIVGRIVVEEDTRKVVFKSKDYVFGGGRLPGLKVDEIELDADAFIDLYDISVPNNKKRKPAAKSKPTEEPKEEAEDTEEQQEEIAEKSKRKRRSRKAETEEVEEPKRKRRSRKTEEPAEVDTDPEDDETPPGEEGSTEEEVSDEPKRKRRERKKPEEKDEAAEEPTTRRRRRRR
ncbi:AAA family ATPase [Marinilactibacillus psychrotolerans]|uniref:NTP-binding protein n=1 Tax=Marinilactibacillus psychrotolerans TaxID=191770 RepID=A0AAV3WT85_9LACT|nr:AAA family ATPase [Marinilactibacillus psychrotolerans]GEL67226.1 NTP-binding protein [Marinilactibacillus psychrotolerans]GEQ36030.1 NTP-binding protein [Marinilactibacillus psychrotolerans]SDC60512.1 phage nucleotide-binding protein [Marinilactibacillus psychrotolerans]